MFGSTVDIQSVAAKIRRGKRRKKPQRKNIMACPIPQGGHNNITDEYCTGILINDISDYIAKNIIHSGVKKKNRIIIA